MWGRSVFAGLLALASAAFGQEDRFHQLVTRGSAAEVAGDFAGALDIYREASALADQFDRSDSRRVYAYNSVGLMYDALGRFADSENAYRRALSAMDALPAPAPLNRAVLLANLGNVCLEMGQEARAEKLLRESIALHVAIEPRSEVRLAVARNGLAELLLAQGRLEESAALVQATLSTLHPLPEAATEIGIANNNLGAIRLYQGRYSEAVVALEQSLAALEAVRGSSHPILLRTLHNLAIARQRSGHRRSAGDSWRRAMDLGAATLGIEHPLYGEILKGYANYLHETGDKAAGKAIAARATAILRDHQRRNGLGSVVDVSALQRGAR